MSRHDPQGQSRRSTVFYAVLETSKEPALSAIISAVEADDYVDLTEGRRSAETGPALGLVPGVPKAI